ncbi:hypothetical protein LWF15_00425 [Kineosporia rhizophila]|uniref:hypothetical protein n=1 Tax=Kineosporia rhizophila TaxID=84633 RepID=UPI001E4F8256|nr:hypothetical protein [Kineosporia rhizophila]MCE0533969.1 hypothetical protein [Kineosporia rhizophila]
MNLVGYAVGLLIVVALVIQAIQALSDALGGLFGAIGQALLLVVQVGLTFFVILTVLLIWRWMLPFFRGSMRGLRTSPASRVAFGRDEKLVRRADEGSLSGLLPVRVTLQPEAGEAEEAEKEATPRLRRGPGNSWRHKGDWAPARPVPAGDTDAERPVDVVPGEIVARESTGASRVPQPNSHHETEVPGGTRAGWAAGAAALGAKLWPRRSAEDEVEQRPQIEKAKPEAGESDGSGGSGSGEVAVRESGASALTGPPADARSRRTGSSPLRPSGPSEEQGSPEAGPALASGASVVSREGAATTDKRGPASDEQDERPLPRRRAGESGAAQASEPLRSRASRLLGRSGKPKAEEPGAGSGGADATGADREVSPTRSSGPSESGSPLGTAGAVGAASAAGAASPAGVSRADDASSSDGTRGSTGAFRLAGPAGSSDAVDSSGAVGSSGAAGSSGPAGSSGAANSSSAVGSSGAADSSVPADSSRPVGLPGSTGASRLAGADASSRPDDAPGPGSPSGSASSSGPVEQSGQAGSSRLSASPSPAGSTPHSTGASRLDGPVAPPSSAAPPSEASSAAAREQGSLVDAGGGTASESSQVRPAASDVDPSMLPTPARPKHAAPTASSVVPVSPATAGDTSADDELDREDERAAEKSGGSHPGPAPAPVSALRRRSGDSAPRRPQEPYDPSKNPYQDGAEEASNDLPVPRLSQLLSQSRRRVKDRARKVGRFLPGGDSGEEQVRSEKADAETESRVDEAGPAASVSPEPADEPDTERGHTGATVLGAAAAGLAAGAVAGSAASSRDEEPDEAKPRTAAEDARAVRERRPSLREVMLTRSHDRASEASANEEPEEPKPVAAAPETPAAVKPEAADAAGTDAQQPEAEGTGSARLESASQAGVASQHKAQPEPPPEPQARWQRGLTGEQPVVTDKARGRAPEWGTPDSAADKAATEQTTVEPPPAAPAQGGSGWGEKPFTFFGLHDEVGPDDEGAVVQPSVETDEGRAASPVGEQQEGPDESTETAAEIAAAADMAESAAGQSTGSHPLPKDSQARDSQARDSHVTGTRAEDVRAEGVRAEGVRVEGVRAEGVRVEGVRAKDTRAEDALAKETWTEDLRAEDARSREPQSEETLVQHQRAQEPQAEDPRAENVLAEEGPSQRAPANSLQTGAEPARNHQTQNEQAQDEQAGTLRPGASQVDRPQAPSRQVEGSQAPSPQTESPQTESPQAEGPKAGSWQVGSAQAGNPPPKDRQPKGTGADAGTDGDRAGRAEGEAESGDGRAEEAAKTAPRPEAPITPRSIPGQRERVLLSGAPDLPELTARKSPPRRAQPHQLSTYTYRNELPHLDLETRLADEAVCQAALDLAASPEDEGARQLLLESLVGDGAAHTESRTLLQVTALRGSGGAVAEFLDGLVLMRDLNARAFPSAPAPVPGVIATSSRASRTSRIDNVYAVTPDRAARDLLSGVPGFTRALANWAMIADDEDRPDLEAAFQRAVANMPMELLDAIRHAIKLAPPLPGVPLRVDRLTGVVTTLPEEQATEVPGEGFPAEWRRSERRFYQ